MTVFVAEASGAIAIVDDEPAPVREWLPVVADALGAKPPSGIQRCPASPLAD